MLLRTGNVSLIQLKTNEHRKCVRVKVWARRDQRLVGKFINFLTAIRM